MARTKQKARKNGGGEKRKADTAPPSQQQQGAANKNGAKKQKVAAQKKPQEDSKSLAAVTLKELLGGMDLDVFFAQYFEKKPLHVRSNDKHKVRICLICCMKCSCLCVCRYGAD